MKLLTLLGTGALHFSDRVIDHGLRLYVRALEETGGFFLSLFDPLAQLIFFLDYLTDNLFHFASNLNYGIKLKK